MLSIKEGIATGKYLDPPVTSVFRGQRQITKQNSTHACLAATIPNFIIFDRMKDILVVNSITEFDRYWSGNSRVTADLLSDLTVLIRGFFSAPDKMWNRLFTNGHLLSRII